MILMSFSLMLPVKNVKNRLMVSGFFISLGVVKSFPDFKWFISTGILAFFCQDYYRCSWFGK